jgi:hypothetical protein
MAEFSDTIKKGKGQMLGEGCIRDMVLMINAQVNWQEL